MCLKQDKYTNHDELDGTGVKLKQNRILFIIVEAPRYTHKNGYYGNVIHQ